MTRLPTHPPANPAGEVAKIDALRKQVAAYRLLAVNEGWNWNMAEAYGHAEYLRHRIEEVDRKAAGTLGSAYDAAGYLRDGLNGPKL